MEQRTVVEKRLRRRDLPPQIWQSGCSRKQTTMPPISVLTTRRARRLLLGTAVLSASVLARSLMAPATHAGYTTCASEPVALLSNGYTLDMDTIIDDSASDVQQVNYVLSVPSGVFVVNWTDTSAVGPSDTYSVSATNNAGHYSVAVTAETGTSAVNVTSSTTLVDPSGTAISSESVVGLSQQKLWMQVSGW